MKGIWVLIILLIIGYLICNCKNKNRQNFQILAAAGPYQAQYVQCLNECQKEDPGDRLGVNNLTCGAYCDSVITELIENGIPPEDVPIKNNLTECEQECNEKAFPDSTKEDIRKCISSCHGAKEVSQYCAELWCPYSRFPHDLCMNMCTSSNGANNNQNAWNWGRFG